MADSAEDQAALWALMIGFDKYAYRAVEQVDDQLYDLESALIIQMTRFFERFYEDDDITAQTVAYLMYALREVFSEIAKLDGVIADSVAVHVEGAAQGAVDDLQRHIDYLADVDVSIGEVALVATVLDAVRAAAIQRTEMYALSQPQQLLSAIRSTMADGIGRSFGAFQSVVIRQIPAVFKAARSRAKALVVNETALAYSAAYREAAVAVAKSGVLPPEVTVYYRWDAVRDRKTCMLCRSLDGKIVGSGESYDTVHRGEYESYMYPPSHPNCRCVLFITFSRDEGDTRTTTRF